MKPGLLISVVLLISIHVYGQEIRANMEISYAMYSMSSLKGFQQQLIQSSNLPMQAVQTFPAYYGYAFSLTTTLRRAECGIFFGYNSTAGRIDLEDYTGSIRSDQLLNCFTYGILYQHQLYQLDKWRIYASIHLSTVLSNLSIANSIQVGGVVMQNSQADLYATSYGVRPGLQLRREFGIFSIYTAAGYEIQSQGTLRSKNFI